MGTNSKHKIRILLLKSSTSNVYNVTLEQEGRDIVLQEIEPDQGLRLLGYKWKYQEKKLMSLDGK